MRLGDLYPHAPHLSGACVERFWSKVDDGAGEDACWPWTAYTTQSGYGHVSVQVGHDEQRDVRVHRVAYMLTHGEVADDLRVCHSCDNPPCCNPRHLWQGTDADNMRDCWRKGRNGGGLVPGGNAKISADQAEKIRREYAMGGVSQVVLAERYGVSRSNIGVITRGESWKEGA